MLYELTDVKKRYRQGSRDVDALAGVDLSIAAGEFVAIQGSDRLGQDHLAADAGRRIVPAVARHSSTAATWARWGRATWRS